MKASFGQYKCAFILAGLIGVGYGVKELYGWIDVEIFKQQSKDPRNFVIQETVDEYGIKMYRLLNPRGGMIEASRSRPYLLLKREQIAYGARTDGLKWEESKSEPEEPEDKEKS